MRLCEAKAMLETLRLVLLFPLWLGEGEEEEETEGCGSHSSERPSSHGSAMVLIAVEYVREHKRSWCYRIIMR